MVYGAAICIISCILFMSTIFWMGSAKKWFKRQIKILEHKKKELDELIMSATDMVHELNNVSDYVVTAIDEKSLEIKDVMSEIDVKIAECRKMFEGGINSLPSNVVEIRKETNKDCQGIIMNREISNSEKIRVLYNDGNDIVDIAKELGIGKGEVQLILGITNRCMELAN